MRLDVDQCGRVVVNRSSSYWQGSYGSGQPCASLCVGVCADCGIAEGRERARSETSSSSHGMTSGERRRDAVWCTGWFLTAGMCRVRESR